MLRGASDSERPASGGLGLLTCRSQLLKLELGRLLRMRSFSLACVVARVMPQAAIWPHQDVVIGGGGPSLLVLLQPAQQGGHFRIAKEADVSWREADAGGLTLAQRVRDTVYVPLQECGDVCCFDGCTYVHEVSRVYGSEPRLTVSVTLACGCT